MRRRAVFESVASRRHFNPSMAGLFNLKFNEISLCTYPFFAVQIRINDLL